MQNVHKFPGTVGGQPFHTHNLGGGKGPEHHYREDHIKSKLHETDLMSGMRKINKESKTAPRVCFSRTEKSTEVLLAALGGIRILNDSRRQCLPLN